MISAWINNYTHVKQLYVITHPFPTFMVVWTAGSFGQNCQRPVKINIDLCEHSIIYPGLLHS